MNDHISVVKEDPPGLGIAFQDARTNVPIGQVIGDGPADGSQLALVLAGANDEIIRDERQFVDVHHLGIDRWSIRYDIGNGEREFPRLGDRIDGEVVVLVVRGEIYRSFLSETGPLKKMTTTALFAARRWMVGPAGFEPATKRL